MMERVHTRYSACLFAALMLGNLASAEEEPAATMYGDPAGCIEWDQARILELEGTAPLLEQSFPNSGKIVLKSQDFRFRLKDYNDNVIKAQCDGGSYLFDDKVTLSDRKAVVFLFTYPDGEAKILHIKRRVRCSKQAVDALAHNYEKISRLYHERAEFLFWGHDVSWEISIDAKCSRVKAENPLAPRAWTAADVVCDSGTVSQ
jgi:hypothetical protein